MPSSPSMAACRLHKFLAESGVASRRASERLIRAGHVSVNGEVISQLGTKVHPSRDQVAVDGVPVRPKRRIYVALHKPLGYLCTRRDTARRRVVGELLPPEWSHLVCVGRLDYDSQGLLFLSNDGEFTYRLTHPRFGARKTYLVTVEGRVDPRQLSRLTQGIIDHGETLRAVSARLLSSNNSRSELELVLTEGKNREIRRLLAALDLQVSRLIRTQIGPVRLGELPVGKWRTLTESEIESLLPPL